MPSDIIGAFQGDLSLKCVLNQSLSYILVTVLKVLKLLMTLYLFSSAQMIDGASFLELSQDRKQLSADLEITLPFGVAMKLCSLLAEAKATSNCPPSTHNTGKSYFIFLYLKILHVSSWLRLATAMLYTGDK